MRRFAGFLVRLLAIVTLAAGARASAQRHSLGSAPPTAPVVSAPKPATAAPVVRPPAPTAAHSAVVPSGPIAPVSAGMGAIQFLPASSPVPAPQTLTRQLFAEDERTRLGALSSLGVPGEYLVHGRVPFAHSVQLDMAALGSSDELDALLTVELDQHVVNAVLIPEGSGWRRIATLSFASSFSAGVTTPSTFVRPQRSFLEPNRYRAVYRATVNGQAGDFTENEADLRVVNGHADVVISFVSGARQCDTSGQLRPPHQTCELTQRWLEPDLAEGTHHLVLITGVGHISAHEASDPLSNSRNYRLTRLRSFACQPFLFLEGQAHFEPVANSAPCPGHESIGPTHPEHPAAEHAGAEHAAPVKTTPVTPERATPEHADHP